MNKKINEKTSSFENLIDQINETAGPIQRERGTLFEKLVIAYLKNEPMYKNLFTDVWLLNEVPNYYSIPKKDTGVDIVARQKDGNLVGIQAKFYTQKFGKDQINSFIAELSKKYYKSGLIISTVDDWSSTALETVRSNEKGIEIIGLSDLKNSQIDWSQFNFKRPESVKTKSRKYLRNYQQLALENAKSHFKDFDRGQMIMAPGTGKTFTSLKITEALSKEKENQFRVLYLVPSIQLLTQTLRGWNNDTELSITSMAVTSDRDASRDENGTEDIKATDIGYPATTSMERMLENWESVKRQNKQDDLLVVFSTYQSIDVVGRAQDQGFPEFDLIISDEAHRTTGAYEAVKGDTTFSKVHSNNNVSSIKRLYQTATPKIYGENAKKNAKEKSIVISSMDDDDKYGDVFYRLGFGTAVSYGILTDYKVMVLAIDESAIQKDMQRALSDSENGLDIDDLGRIIGIWNGMMRRNGYKNPLKKSAYSGPPLERAIAFTRTIADSKKVTHQFEEVVNEYLNNQEDVQKKYLSMRHADGSMNALQKGEVLDWLADPKKPEDEARIVSNVRFLTEGIDVPTLDAVIFMAPKKSQVDIVQAVGRIMRKSEDKDYGYIILPIVVPTTETPETILDNNKNYEAVWQVINALRSVDERFEAMIDKINIAKPKQLEVIGIGAAPDKANDHTVDKEKEESPTYVQSKLEFEWDKFESAIYGKIVQKVGDRKYLENWSKDVAKIAQRQIAWIKTKLSETNNPITTEFKKFVSSLQHNINNSIGEDQAIEMLSQHLITKPVFEALFSEYSFVNSNPVSLAMENIVRELEEAGFSKEQENLEPLYESVRMRANGVEKSEDKQKIIIALYDKFFSTAFKTTTERLGIVFTPVEVVDFIVKSIDDILRKHFGKNLSSKDVHVLDPFTGTGTFMVRTLNYLKEKLDNDEISLEDITRKFTQELHANEIVLLSYYIAAINIEATFNEIKDTKEEYTPFEGIVLTDTFESIEDEPTFNDTYFEMNDVRLKKQQEATITAIIGNPPYSVGQNNANDDNQNNSYPYLESRISNTYAKFTKSSLKKSLYDSYVMAFRWASDRISSKGIIGFVTNGSFIDNQSMSGLRKCIQEEFNYAYIFNLRGDQRTIGEKSRQEGGKIFGSGSRTPVAITILVKDGSENKKILYHDIGDYLSREQKLEIVKNIEGVDDIHWKEIFPDDNHDWINQRDLEYEKFTSIDQEYFKNRAVGVSTSRDAWVYGFSRNNVITNVDKLILNYNSEVSRLKDINEPKFKLSQRNKEGNFIKWSDKLSKHMVSNDKLEVSHDNVVIGMYRPFVKKWLYYDTSVIERPGRFKDLYEDNDRIIYTTGKGASREFSALAINNIPNYHLMDSGQSYFENVKADNLFPFESNITNTVKDNLSLSDTETFYYVYAVLNSNTYKDKYYAELNKDFPRVPLLKNKMKYVEIGEKLMNLHINYEKVPAYEYLEVDCKDNPSFKVTKMKYTRRNEKDTIIFNDDITIRNIPSEAYKYIVNGKPAIQWIMEQYQVKVDKNSGIIDDPNEFSDDPKYIFNLVLSVINLSVITNELVNELPDFEIEE